MFRDDGSLLRIALFITLFAFSAAGFCQQPDTLPDAPQPAQISSLVPADLQAQTGASSSNSADTDKQNSDQSTSNVKPSQQQPQRILGIMPNFRAVSAGEIPPPPTPKQAFVIATKNSIDYSSFIFVGVTSLLAEGTNAHSQLGKGVDGYWAYYWRGFLDKTDGNYMVVYAFPTVLHQDGRYFAKGEGNIFKRAIYASSRIIITRKYDGDPTFNTSEIVGRGVAQAISLSYYPSGSRTLGALSEKYAYALGRDALTNTFREFWPDIATHVLHRHP